MSHVRDLFERLTDVEPRSSASEILERAERQRVHLRHRRTRRRLTAVGVVAVLLVGAVFVAARAGRNDRGQHTAAATDRYEVDATVEQSATQGPVLCLGPQLKSSGSICSGIPVAGWDWNKVGDHSASNGITSGYFHLVGTFDGTAFTPSEPPTPARQRPAAPPKLPSFRPPCPTPSGGWVDVDPTRLTPNDFNAFSAAAQNQPDSAGFWIDSSQRVYTVAFTGDLDRHRAELRALWGGPFCVIQHKHSTAELAAALTWLTEGAGKTQLDLGPLVGGDVDPINEVVHLQVAAATRAMRDAVDRKYGAGLVEITGYLTPLP